MLPSFIGALAWKMLLSPRAGYINRLWRDMAILFCGSAFIAFFALPGTVWLVPLVGVKKILTSRLST